MNIIRLYSDNYDGVLLTESAYKEVCLQMELADWHSHDAYKVVPSQLDEVLDLRNVQINKDAL